jgi:bile acid-coenzyme A ligase
MTSSTSFPERFQQLANEQANHPAVTDLERTLTFSELWTQATQLAHVYEEAGVRHGGIVSIALPTNASFVVATLASWIVGATPQPLSYKTAPVELRAILELSESSLLVGLGDDYGVPTLPDVAVAAHASTEELPLVASPAWKAPVSGGSTGRPKVIVAAQPAQSELVLPLGGLARITPDSTSLITAPLYHNGPFLFTMLTLLSGAQVVLTERFEAERTLRMIEEYSATWVYMVPTMMSRISKLPDEIRNAFDLSSLVTLFHLAAPCPPWLKHFWIDWLGPDVIWELYAGTEAQAVTVISGSQWLEHPGSVGPAVAGEITVLDPEGRPVPAGTVGEVWMRSTAGPTYRYMGAEAKTRDEGWESLGDLGYLDDDGYLYLCDRLADMVIVGGANVYPAEVEAALEEHPSVVGAVVIGVPDDDMGKRLHALIHLSADVSDDELREWCAPRLSPYKTPRTFERVDQPLRDDAAKVRRSSLSTERSGS